MNKKILVELKNEKHKTILFMLYSAGLRVGKVIKLQPKDIDSQRMLIHVVQGKVIKIATQSYQKLHWNSLENIINYISLKYGCFQDRIVKNTLQKEQFREYLKTLVMLQK